MAEFIGGPIRAEVLTQLDRRREIYKKAGNLNPDIASSERARTDKEFQYLYSRNAWVRVISSVDIPNNYVEATVKYDNSLAKKYVLSNLSYLDDQGYLKSQAGLDFKSRTDSSKAYAFSNSVGTRPRPGINSFTVISKGRFGTTKEANIGFNVWSPEDLEDIEKLYFRPGFSCVIQFGHSLYVDNKDGKITTPTGINALESYFKDNPLEGENGIFQNLFDTRENSNYNSENFVGFIKNFSWSFRPDGGYDCSLSVISQGEVLDSISMKVGLPEDAYEEGNENTKYNENIVKRFLGDLRNTNLTPEQDTYGLVSTDDMTTYFKNIFNSITIPETNDLIVTGGIIVWKPGTTVPTLISKRRWIAIKKWCQVDLGSGKGEIIYFPLRNLIHVINNHYFPKNKYGSNIIEIDSKSEQPYFSFKQHVSLDPTVCLLPKRVQLYKANNTIKPVSLVPTYFKQITRLEKDLQSNEDTSGSRILDILITDLLVEQALNNAGDTIQNFINYILDSITKALGGLNEFMLVPVENSLKMELYDQAVTPNRKNFTEIINDKRLDLTGVGSLFTDLKIETKISKNLVSMISIAAQGVVDGGEDYGGMLAYNKGYKDRFVGSNNTILKCDYEDNGEVLSPFLKLLARSTTTLNPIINIALLYNKFLKDRQKREEAKKETDILTYGKFGLALLNSYKKLFEYGFFYTTLKGKYDAGLFSLLQEEGLPYFKNFYIYDQLGNINGVTDEKTNIGKGLIPVELSFTMDGIGGLSIGQAFQVKPGVLPSYYDNTGFIITGVENTIQNNRWYTTVRAQTFLLHVENDQGDAQYQTYNLYGSSTDVEKQETTNNTATETAEISQQSTSNELVGQGSNFLLARYVASRYLYGLGSSTTISDREWDLLLRATAGETGGNEEESAAIVSVILNRTKNRFLRKTSITGTLYADNQFEAVTGDRPNPEFIKPTSSRLNSIALGIEKYLKNYENRKWLNFTSKNTQAYKGSLDFYNLALNTPGREIIGDSIFFTADNR